MRWGIFSSSCFIFFFTAVDFFNNEQITLERQKKHYLSDFLNENGRMKSKKDNKNIKKTLTHDFLEEVLLFFLQFLEMDFSWRLNFECFKRIAAVPFIFWLFKK